MVPRCRRISCCTRSHKLYQSRWGPPTSILQKDSTSLCQNPGLKLTRISQTFNAINSGQFLQFNEFFGNGTRTLNSLATICILRSSISCRPKAQNKLTNSESFSPSILKKSFTRFLVKPRDNPKGLMQFGQLLQFKGIHRSFFEERTSTLNRHKSASSDSQAFAGQMHRTN